VQASRGSGSDRSIYRKVFTSYSITGSVRGIRYLLVASGTAVLGAAVVKQHDRLPRHSGRRLNTSNEPWARLTLPNTRSSVVWTFSFRKRTPVRKAKFTLVKQAILRFSLRLRIRLALQSGRDAARCLIDGTSFDERRSRFYDRRLEKALVNRFLFETSGNAAFRLFLWRAGVRIFATPASARTARMVDENVRSDRETAWEQPKPCVHGERCAWCRAT